MRGTQLTRQLYGVVFLALVKVGRGVVVIRIGTIGITLKTKKG